MQETNVAEEGKSVTPFMMAALLLGLDLDAVPMCFSSDVEQLCCPSACATKNSPKWTQANDVLHACGGSVAATRNRRVRRLECGAIASPSDAMTTKAKQKPPKLAPRHTGTLAWIGEHRWVRVSMPDGAKVLQSTYQLHRGSS